MSEREQIVARLSELQAKQEAATEWGAAVGAREEEIRSLESRLLRIDAMTAPPSTETPRHTATPWVADEHQVFDLSGERIAVCNGHVTPSDEAQYARWKADAALIVTACNSHASLTARVAELEAALQQIKAKTEGDRPTVNPENAFVHWSNLNAALVIIRGLARAALEAKP